MSTLANVRTTPVTLSSSDPTLTVTSTGGINIQYQLGMFPGMNETPFDAVYGPTGVAATLVNSGTLYSARRVVNFSAGGFVTNTAGGTINGAGLDGVKLFGGTGTVRNSGRISGAAGVVIDGGGYVLNNSGGSIAGGEQSQTDMETYRNGTFYPDYYSGESGTNARGVLISSGIGTVVNFGQITGGTGDGVDLQSAGSVRNSGTIGSAGGSGVDISGGAGTVVNTGVLTGGTTNYSRSNYGVPGAVRLQMGGSVNNSGTIRSLSSHNPYGTLGAGVLVQGAAGTVSNSGTISGLTAVYLTEGGSVSNTGVLIDTYHDQYSKDIGAVVKVLGGSGTVSNAGVITLNGIDDNYAVFLGAGGVVNNVGTSSYILSGIDGVAIAGGSGTVDNAGTIRGGGDAIQFKGSFDDRVVLRPGAVVLGAVQGGSGTNTLEMAAGSAGSVGTLSAFSTEFLTFGTVAVDAGATWSLASGVTFGAGVTVGNAGTLKGDGTLAAGAAPLTNSGTIQSHYGVKLLGGGTINNYGAITSFSGNTADGDIVAGGGPVTLVDAGLLLTDGIDDVVFNGSFNDRVVLTPGTSFSSLGAWVVGGSGTNTLELRNSIFAGTLTAFIGEFTNFGTLAVDAGATWTLASTATVGSGIQFTDAGSLTNAGKVASTVSLAAGTTLFNTGSIGTSELAVYAATAAAVLVSNTGTITANDGAIRLKGGGSVANSGTASRMSATQAYTVLIENGLGTVTNAGTIIGHNDAVELTGGGTVTNTGSASSIAGTSGYAVLIQGAAGTVTNAGTITGRGDGVVLKGGGTVVNTGSASSIASSNTGVGVLVQGGAGTVLDTGTISGGAGGTAIQFSGTFIDRVVLSPGAVLTGTVKGGSYANQLELGAGTGAGTLTAFGSQFTNFGTIVVDPGSTWTLASGAQVPTGVQLLDYGLLTNDATVASAVYLGNGGTLVNAGYVADNKLVSNPFGTGVFSSYASASISNTGTIFGSYYGVKLFGGGVVTNGGTGDITSGGDGVYAYGAVATVVDAGTISGAKAIVFGGTSSGTVVLSPGAVLAGAVQGGKGSNTLELASSAAVGTLTGFAGQFKAFGAIDVDLRASWSLGGAGETIASAIANVGTLTDAESGTLVLTGSLGGAGTFAVAAGSSLSLTSVGTILSGNVVDAGTLTNAGGIRPGVTLAGGGSLFNAGAVGALGAANYGVSAGMAAAGVSVGNSGTITGGRAGVMLADGGTVTNSGAGGQIAGLSGYGVKVQGAAGTVSNAGTISAASSSNQPTGLALLAGGTVTNTGTILTTSSGTGVMVQGGAGTVIDSGTISAGSTGANAIQFSGSFADLVELAPGAVLTGRVQGGAGTNTLELMSAASTGTLSGFASQFRSFGTVALDSGAHWELDGASPAGGSQAVTMAGTGDLLALGTPGSFADSIAGFSATDSLDLVGLTYAPGATATLSGSTLTVTSNGATDALTLAGIASGTKFAVTQDSVGGSIVQENPACFCRGTLILTDRGELPVETLEIGDGLLTRSGAVRPLRWIGWRSYGGRFLRRSPQLQPIRLSAGCLGEGLPRRDLLISPDHAMWLDGVLVPARALVNGSTITAEHGMAQVEYYHLELETHDVIVAEGAASESFLDDDSRGVFHNAAEFAALYPDAPPPGLFCAPRVEQGYAVDAIRRRLASIGGMRRAG